METCLQVTDALSYLAARDLVHGGVSSHSVIMTTVHVAKLGLMERTVRRGELPPQPPEFLYNWLSPEILLLDDELAATADDVYGLSVVLWELCTRTVPWAHLQPGQIFDLVKEGEVLTPDRANTPKLLVRLLREGLVWDRAHRDLGLDEVRDMLLICRDHLDNSRRERRPPGESRQSDLKLFSPSRPQSELKTKYGLSFPPSTKKIFQEHQEQRDSISLPELTQKITRTVNFTPSSSGQKQSLSARFSRSDKMVFARKYEQLSREVKLQDIGNIGQKLAGTTLQKAEPSSLKSAAEKESPEEKSSANSLNVSSRSLYESALESPWSSFGQKKTGTFLRHWERRERLERPVSSDQPDNREEFPASGSVREAIKFYQSKCLAVSSPLEMTHYHSALSALPSPAPPASKKTRDQTVQTETETPRLVSSTPLTGQRFPTSPLDCSPLFLKKRTAHTLKASGLVSPRPIEDSFHSVASPSPADSESRAVDFSNPDGRQDLFRTALGQASHDQSFQVRKPPVVTFNNNVEEITTSIVSIADSTHSRTNLEEDFATAQDSGDMYLDDGLPTAAEEEPINMQLLSQQGEEGGARKVGDRVLAQLPSDGGWYPATVSILSGQQATVAFDHDLRLRTVELDALRDSQDTEGDSRFETIREETLEQNLVENLEEGDDGEEGDEKKEDQVEEEEEETTAYRTSLETAWREGDLCVAQWEEDGLWYRAVIDDIQGDTAAVTFTEYGNSAYTQVKQLMDPDTHINEDGLLGDQQDDDWS